MESRTFALTDDAHADPELTLYLLGVLQDEERIAFEAHLLTCPQCLAECERLGPLVSTMGTLDPSDVDTPPDPVPAPKPASTPGHRPARAHRVNPSRRRSWSRPQLAVLALATVVAIGIGAVGGFIAGREQSNAPTSISLVAVGDGESSDASMSVFVLGRRDGVTVHATVTRLEPGVLYRLLAVTAEGRTLVVTEWWGQEGVQDISGDLDVAADSLAFFSVVRADGTQVMLARVQR